MRSDLAHCLPYQALAKDGSMLHFEVTGALLSEGLIMHPRMTLTVKGGRLDGYDFPIEMTGTYVIGRANDCDVRLPCGEEFQTVSRHHCLLGVNPYTLWVRDLGSRNGTCINGDQIGKPEVWAKFDDAEIGPCAEHELKDGDELKVGGTILRVQVPAAPVASPILGNKAAKADELCGCE
jgi:eukaryotic-like serine/threonine-protein kinase